MSLSASGGSDWKEVTRAPGTPLIVTETSRPGARGNVELRLDPRRVDEVDLPSLDLVHAAAQPELSAFVEGPPSD